jgi:hypothetical protein
MTKPSIPSIPKPKCVSLRIRRVYFDQIVKGEKTAELRKHTDFWQKRLLGAEMPKVAVFVCGKDVHRRRITRIAVCRPESILGRPLSEQGKKDIPTERCFAIMLGKQLQCRDCGNLEEMVGCNECPDGYGWPCKVDKKGQHVHPDMTNCRDFVFGEGFK